MKKTLVALFVALCMVLTMAPAMAFAADEPRIDSVVFYATGEEADEALGVEGNVDQTFVVNLKAAAPDAKIGVEIVDGINRYRVQLTDGSIDDINRTQYVFSLNKEFSFCKNNWKPYEGKLLLEKGESYDLEIFTYTTWDDNGRGQAICTTDITVPADSTELASGFFDVITDPVKGTPFEGKEIFSNQTFYTQVAKDEWADGRESYLFEVEVDGKTYSTLGHVAWADTAYSKVNVYASFLDKVDFIDQKLTDASNKTFTLAPGAYTVKVSVFEGTGYNGSTANPIPNYPNNATEYTTFEITVASADYSEWDALVAYINNLDEMDYTEDGWEHFQGYIAIYLSEDSSLYVKPDQAKLYQATIDAGVLNLQKYVKYIKGQKTADYSYLNAMIAVAEGLDKSDYTADSWETVETALKEAKDVPLRQGTGEQDNITNAAVKLVLAMSKLVGVEKANYAAVDAAIAKAETLTEADYTADSWAAVEAAINAVVRDLPVSDQAKVDAMAKAINDAIDALVAAEPEDPTDPEDPTEIVFDDVEQGRWSAQYIYDLVEKGICDGIGDNKFNPEGNIERCAFAKILAEASGDDLTRYEGTSNFADCRGSWAETYINWAYANGIVTGRTDTTFDPYGEISRQEMAAMIYRYAEYKGIELPETNELITFDDEEQIADYAAEAVDAMQKAGIINGMDNNEFQPQGTATREQAAKMISVLLSL